MVKIFVGNIREGANAGELKPLFEKYGLVEECDIITNYGFVHMSSHEDAEAAVKGMDGSYFSGSNIKVELSHNKPPRRGGGRGGGGGFGGPRGGGGGFRGSRGGGGGFRGDRDRFGGRDRDRGFERERNGYGRDRGYDRGSRYDDYPPPRVVDDRDMYARDSYRDSYRGGDSFAPRDYERDSYSRDFDRRAPRFVSKFSRLSSLLSIGGRDSYREDPYERRPRDPYPREQFSRDRRDAYPRESRGDPFSAASYRDRSPIDRKRPQYGAPRYR